MTKRACIVVDVQPTFCEGGELGVEGGNRVAHDIARYLANHRDRYDLVISTQDWHRDPGAHFSDTPDFEETWPAHGMANTPNAELHPALSSINFDNAVKKGMYSAAYSGFEGLTDDGATLKETLLEAGVTHLDIVGIALSHCVCQTALDAHREGFKTRVLLDLTVPVTPEQGEEAIARMSRAGIELTRLEEGGR